MRARNSLLRVARPCRSKVFAAARVICFMRVFPIFTYASDQYAANLFSLSLAASAEVLARHLATIADARMITAVADPLRRPSGRRRVVVQRHWRCNERRGTRRTMGKLLRVPTGS